MSGAIVRSLHVSNVKAGYHGRDILHGVSFDIPAGSALTVVGPNGSGKSTLIKVVAGLVAARTGTLRLGETDVTALGAPQRARAGIGYVPQVSNVFPNMSVIDNLRLSNEFLPAHSTNGAQAARRSGQHWRERVDEILALLPTLRAKLDVKAGLLSGGQRQTVAVASALMAKPGLLALDEPSAGLSPKAVGELFELIQAIRDSGVTLFMIEQNVRLGLRLADIGLVLVGGQVRAVADAETLARDPALRQMYLGNA